MLLYQQGPYYPELFVLTDHVIETSLMVLRFVANWVADDKPELTSKTFQDDFNKVTKSSFSNQLALNLNGLRGLRSLFNTCKKTGWWFESPPHPNHFLKCKSQSRRSANINKILQILCFFLTDQYIDTSLMILRFTTN